jgi:hypothetical protein
MRRISHARKGKQVRSLTETITSNHNYPCGNSVRR